MRTSDFKAKGYDRAQDRMNSNGAANSQAEGHVGGTAGAGTTRQ